MFHDRLEFLGKEPWDARGKNHWHFQFELDTSISLYSRRLDVDGELSLNWKNDLPLNHADDLEQYRSQIIPQATIILQSWIRLSKNLISLLHIFNIFIYSTGEPIANCVNYTRSVWSKIKIALRHRPVDRPTDRLVGYFQSSSIHRLLLLFLVGHPPPTIHPARARMDCKRQCKPLLRVTQSRIHPPQETNISTNSCQTRRIMGPIYIYQRTNLTGWLELYLPDREVSIQVLYIVLCLKCAQRAFNTVSFDRTQPFSNIGGVFGGEEERSRRRRSDGLGSCFGIHHLAVSVILPLERCGW